MKNGLSGSIEDVNVRSSPTIFNFSKDSPDIFGISHEVKSNDGSPVRVDSLNEISPQITTTDGGQSISSSISTKVSSVNSTWMRSSVVGVTTDLGSRPSNVFNVEDLSVVEPEVPDRGETESNNTHLDTVDFIRVTDPVSFIGNISVRGEEGSRGSRNGFNPSNKVRIDGGSSDVKIS